MSGAGVQRRGDNVDTPTRGVFQIRRLGALAAALASLSPTTVAVGGVKATAARVARCRPGQLLVSTSLDRRRHLRGTPVEITVALQNDGDSSCTVATGNCLPQIVISRRAEGVVWNRAQSRILCTYGARVLLRPRRIHRVRVVWDGRRCVRRDPAGCPHDVPPPGSYSIAASWESGSVARATLVLS